MGGFSVGYIGGELFIAILEGIWNDEVFLSSRL